MCGTVETYSYPYATFPFSECAYRLGFTNCCLLSFTTTLTTLARKERSALISVANILFSFYKVQIFHYGLKAYVQKHVSTQDIKDKAAACPSSKENTLILGFCTKQKS